MRLWLALFCLFQAVPAHAVTVSRLYDFEPYTPIEADQLNDELNNIIAAFNGNIDSTNLVNGAVATQNIATAAVTFIALGPLGQQISNSSGLIISATQNDTVIPNMSVNITVVSHPIWVGLQADGVNPGRVYVQHNGGGATGNAAYVTFWRDFATANKTAIGGRAPSGTEITSYPCSDFWFLDIPGPGPHNYTALDRIATSDSGVIGVENCKLAAFEL